MISLNINLLLPALPESLWFQVFQFSIQSRRQCPLIHGQVWTAGNGLNECICCSETSTILHLKWNQSSLTVKEAEAEDRCGVLEEVVLVCAGVRREDIGLQHSQHTTHLQLTTGNRLLPSNTLHCLTKEGERLSYSILFPRPEGKEVS